MRFASIIDDVQELMNDTSKTTEVRRWINRAQDEIQTAYDWPFLILEDFLQTTAVYSTGTVTVVNGDATVTGSSTVWTASMVGRKFRKVSDNQWYVIKTFTSATSIELDRPYEGTGSAGSEYSIFKDTYRVPGDVNKLKLFRNLNQSLVMQFASNTEFDMMIPTITLESDPRVVIIVGRDQDTYSTGTVDATSGSKTITGTSTAWTTPDQISRGLKIRIGNNVYTINTVAATSITVYENIVTTVATADYEIFMNNMVIQFWPPPDTSVGIPFKYFRQLPPLVNDWDESQLPDKYHRLLVWGACKSAFAYQFDTDKIAMAKSEFNEALLLMIRDFRQTTDKINILKSEDSVRRKDVFLLPENYGSVQPRTG